MADANTETTTVNLDVIQGVREAQAAGKSKEVVTGLIDQNRSMIALNNKHQRALGRVGQPLTTRFQSWSDDIPFVAGFKNIFGRDAISVVRNVKDTGKLIWAGIRWIRG